jgi:hypothetical protein
VPLTREVVRAADVAVLYDDEHINDDVTLLVTDDKGKVRFGVMLSIGQAAELAASLTNAANAGLPGAVDAALALA